ncbi:chitinase [Heterostelium album PN500]|uniref:Chitinase n=1 Tax=Heterostelium pallidum (strain ATCC 26659 / Pp 5 / PN500) TaxID=670386 RepID=D3BFR3_HETP5|nr:chitinase [Heterostelium album PN500]EFA79673.1 chitinase [Heterostelium album PN500]|eukprot:XP_020431794.1 chitinase [Heterostelium album PN500]
MSLFTNRYILLITTIILLSVLATLPTVNSQSTVNWQAGVNYGLGQVVKYSNGNCYKVVNVGSNGSDGTDPTVSTWYWSQVTCPSSGTGCSDIAVNWQAGINYGLGQVVKYSNGLYYKVVNVGTNGSDGTDPTVSTWYWSQVTDCSGGGNPGTGWIVSETTFNQIFPNRNSFYTYAGLVAALSAYPAFTNTGTSTTKLQEAAAFLANVYHETGGLVYIREINQANWNSYCQPAGTCGGLQYYGRGPLQLSWNYNYNSCGNALGINLLANPDLVATDSSVSWKTAIWYWNTQKGATAYTPHDAMVTLHAFGETIRAINGGLECNGAAGSPQMQQRVQYYTTICGILGVPTGGSLTC